MDVYNMEKIVKIHQYLSCCDFRGVGSIRNGMSNDWEEEANAVIHDVQQHVHDISISNLPSSKKKIFFNMTTLEMKEFCFELTRDGFMIVGERYDTEEKRGKYPVYETPYSMLDSLSPSYRDSFGERLLKKLSELQKERQKEENENDEDEEEEVEEAKTEKKKRDKKRERDKARAMEDEMLQEDGDEREDRSKMEKGNKREKKKEREKLTEEEKAAREMDEGNSLEVRDPRIVEQEEEDPKS